VAGLREQHQKRMESTNMLDTESCLRLAFAIEMHENWLERPVTSTWSTCGSTRKEALRVLTA
jgi:hypothetical protein